MKTTAVLVLLLAAVAQAQQMGSPTSSCPNGCSGKPGETYTCADGSLAGVVCNAATKCAYAARTCPTGETTTLATTTEELEMLAVDPRCEDGCSGRSRMMNSMCQDGSVAGPVCFAPKCVFYDRVCPEESESTTTATPDCNWWSCGEHEDGYDYYGYYYYGYYGYYYSYGYYSYDYDYDYSYGYSYDYDYDYSYGYSYGYSYSYYSYYGYYGYYGYKLGGTPF